MIKLFVGLGNPGPEYEATRHNAGFWWIDALSRELKAPLSLDKNYHGQVARTTLNGQTVWLLKPATFMNLSGKAVRYWIAEENIPLDRLLVITDDLALPFGAVRLREKGGAGGHNGLTSIIELIGTEDFPRLRFGIGGDFPKGRQSEYVLGGWGEEERKTLAERTELASKAVLQWGLLGMAQAMNSFNKR